MSLLELDPAVSGPSAISARVFATIEHRVLTCAVLPGSGFGRTRVGAG